MCLKHVLFGVISICFFATNLIADKGDSLINVYANQITAESLKSHLQILASDDFEGRETGKQGQKLAANYIAKAFNDYGLQKGVDTSYFQYFNLHSSKIGSASISVGETELELLKDFYFFNGMSKNLPKTDVEIAFLGYGIEDELYSDYNEGNNKHEHVVIWKEEPIDKNGNYIISGNNEKSKWSKDFTTKIELAKSKGVKTLFIISDSFTSDIGRFGYYLTTPKLGLDAEEKPEPSMAVYYISSSAAKKILGSGWNESKSREFISKGKTLKNFSISTNLMVQVEINRDLIQTENVLGFIEGTKKKDEYLIITAHYDHLGVSGKDIYNGADDDGSGTAAVIEIARVIAKAKQEGVEFKRSVIIMPVSGEEKGLLGSEYYAANPVYPLEKTVANLNVDMIGRRDEAHKDSDPYVYLIGSNRLSTNLHTLSESVNSNCCGLFLDYTFNDPNDPNKFYYRSDHYNFIKNGIPAIFYFSGVHEDYHRPTDTVDKIEFDKLAEITRLIFNTAWEIANTEVDLSPNVSVETEEY